ncbi:MAG: alpha/beta hydrolase [Bacteroidota bacterium]
MLSRLLQFVVLALLLVAGCGPLPQDGEQTEGTVVLLHGLARTSNSMRVMEKALLADGYRTCNINYPSTYHPVAVLVRDYVLPALRDCVRNGRSREEDSLLEDVRRAHFVTHSMGGIIVRVLQRQQIIGNMGRVVMLGPPNRGSELVDRLGDLRLFGWLNGPAGQQLSTADTSFVNQLPPATGLSLGVIAGNASLNPVYSGIIPGDDDGKVSVSRTRLDGMRDHLVLPVSHSFMMKNAEVIRQTKHFLRYGQFDHQ